MRQVVCPGRQISGWLGDFTPFIMRITSILAKNSLS